MLIVWLHTSSTRIREAQTSEFALGCRRDVPPPLLVGVHPNPGPRTTGFLAESERWNIIFLSKEKGLSIREISKRLHVAPNTVASTLSRFRETNTVHDRARSGRKRKLSREEEEKMVNETLYQKVLHATLPPARSPDCPRPLKYRWYFIQDNARPHSTVRSMEVLSELTRNRMYDHPANSPDLNIIEDMVLS